MTKNTFTELLKTFFTLKRKHEDPPVVAEAIPALDPVVDVIARCNWKSMGSFTSTSFSRAVEQQKTLSILSNELLTSVMNTLENNAILTEEIAKTLDTVEKKEEEKRDIWDQLIDMAEDSSNKGGSND